MSYESEEAIRRELGRGEKLLWSGQPRRGLRLRPADALMVPVSLLWAGFAVFWERGVIHDGAPLFFMLWGIPFVAMGLYVTIGRFFADAYQRARTSYGVTDQRAIIISGLFSREVKSLSLHGLSNIALRERPDRSGTITFGESNAISGWFAGSGWPGMSKQLVPAFEMIENARQVYDRVRDAQNASSAARIGA